MLDYISEKDYVSLEKIIYKSDLGRNKIHSLSSYELNNELDKAKEKLSNITDIDEDYIDDLKETIEIEYIKNIKATNTSILIKLLEQISQDKNHKLLAFIAYKILEEKWWNKYENT